MEEFQRLSSVLPALPIVLPDAPGRLANKSAISFWGADFTVPSLTNEMKASPKVVGPCLFEISSDRYPMSSDCYRTNPFPTGISSDCYPMGSDCYRTNPFPTEISSDCYTMGSDCYRTNPFPTEMSSVCYRMTHSPRAIRVKGALNKEHS
jgi:hypothetical protein